MSSLSSQTASAGERRRSLLRSIVMAVLSLVLYGGIAWFANREHGSRAALDALGAQAFVSAVNTFASTMIMEYLTRIPKHRWAAFWLGTGGAALWAAAITSLVHWAAGTPNFAMTVLPMLWLSTWYCAMYSFALVRFVHGKKS